MQWFVVVVNLVNVFTLISEDTSCNPGECDDVYQDIVLLMLNIVAQITFTLDMVKLPLTMRVKVTWGNMFIVGSTISSALKPDV